MHNEMNKYIFELLNKNKEHTESKKSTLDFNNDIIKMSKNLIKSFKNKNLN
jgi:hypothetical protein